MYIRLKESKIVESDEISNDIILDYDEGGNVVGIEVLWASEKVDLNQIIIQSFAKVLVENAMARQPA